MERITWDQFFMAQCHLLALRSTCTRLSVGAVLVRDNRIIAGGYNGSVSGDEHCIDHGCYVVGNHCVRTIHAEMNAVLQCSKYGIPVEGASIYVTHFPCLQCTKALIQAGITTVYYAENYRNDPYAIDLFNQTGVTVKHVPFDRRRVEFLSQEKSELMTDLFDKLREFGATEEELAPFVKRADDLFLKQVVK